MFESIVWLVDMLAAAGVVGLVLLQHGKGADVGAAFGSGSAGSLFGSSGAANFLSRSTAILAAVFFVSSLLLTYLSSHHGHGDSVMQKAGVSVPAEAPALPAAGTTKSQGIPVAPAAGDAAPVAPAAPAAADGPAPAGAPVKQ